MHLPLFLSMQRRGQISIRGLQVGNIYMRLSISSESLAANLNLQDLQSL